MQTCIWQNPVTWGTNRNTISKCKFLIRLLNKQAALLNVKTALSDWGPFGPRVSAFLTTAVLHRHGDRHELYVRGEGNKQRCSQQLPNCSTSTCKHTRQTVKAGRGVGTSGCCTFQPCWWLWCLALHPAPLEWSQLWNLMLGPPLQEKTAERDWNKKFKVRKLTTNPKTREHASLSMSRRASYRPCSLLRMTACASFALQEALAVESAEFPLRWCTPVACQAAIKNQ